VRCLPKHVIVEKDLLSRQIDLNTHIQDVIGIIDDADLSDIVLVGNSYGGMVISGVADRVPEKVASLVYLDAFVPENGQSLLSLLPPNLRLATLPGEDWLVAPPGVSNSTANCRSTPLATASAQVASTACGTSLKARCRPQAGPDHVRSRTPTSPSSAPATRS
jgi:pimeloyl-ACP methyl ester carboxylesterase